MTNIIVGEVEILLLDYGAVSQSNRYPIIFVLQHLPWSYLLLVAELPIKQRKLILLLLFAFDSHIAYGDVGVG
jgi:hypothetical protein